MVARASAARSDEGSQDALPRGSVRRASDAVNESDPQLLEDVIRRGLKGERQARHALGYVELGAKLRALLDDRRR